jgi:hypothetical protein
MIMPLCEKCGTVPQPLPTPTPGEICDICLRELWLATVHPEPESDISHLEIGSFSPQADSIRQSS